MSGINQIASADIDQLVEDCAYCHGENGVSTEPTIPTIAGMADFYIIDSMYIYLDGNRPCVEAEYPAGPDKGSKTDMCKIAKELSESDIEALAKYYYDQSFVPATQEFDPGKAEAGAVVHDRACEKCHENGGSVAEDEAGFLAGQWTPYLRQVFDAYDADNRVMPENMLAKWEDLSAEDKENLLHYYARPQ